MQARRTEKRIEEKIPCYVSHHSQPVVPWGQRFLSQEVAQVTTREELGDQVQPIIWTATCAHVETQLRMAKAPMRRAIRFRTLEIESLKLERYPLWYLHGATERTKT